MESSSASGSLTRSPIKPHRAKRGSSGSRSSGTSTLDRDGNTRIDDEHRLIARYAARLAAGAEVNNSTTEMNCQVESTKAQRELIAQLEAKNREIMVEIQRLRIEQEQHAKATPDGHPRNPTLLAELQLLRQRRDELEARMAALQDSRRELMVQLEGLMKLLKNHGSPRSTPNSSPRSRNAVSPPALTRHSSDPSTPGDSLAGVGGDVRQAFNQQQQQLGSSTTSSVRSLRNDLLVAADSVTNAMSSLVKELNTEASNNNNKQYDELAQWQEEMQQRLQQENEFLQELRARKDGHSPQGMSESEQERYFLTDDGEAVMRTDEDSYMATDDADSYVRTDDESYMRTDVEDAELYDKDPKELGSLMIHQRYGTDDESCLETDQESYIRTDDEDGGNTEWEEAMQRWVNR